MTMQHFEFSLLMQVNQFFDTHKWIFSLNVFISAHQFKKRMIPLLPNRLKCPQSYQLKYRPNLYLKMSCHSQNSTSSICHNFLYFSKKHWIFRSCKITIAPSNISLTPTLIQWTIKNMCGTT